MSIGVPVYNGERFLEQALDSLLAQTFRDFELIVSDNASTDRTQEICLAYAARDERVRYVRNRVNIGAAGNFNQVFRLSRGRYFKWAGHDDVCLPDLLLRCVEALDANLSVVLAYSPHRTIDGSGNVSDAEFSRPDMAATEPVVRFANLMRQPFWATPFYGLIRSDVLAHTSLHAPNIAADHHLLAELCLRGSFREVEPGLFLQREYFSKYPSGLSLADRMRHVDPHHLRSDLLLRMELVRAYGSVVARAPLDRRQRVRCYASIAAWLATRAAARVPNRVRHPRARPATRTAVETDP